MSKNWISVEERLPKKAGKYLVLWRLGKDFAFVYSIAFWVNNIAKEYPFKYYENYKERKGGGWIMPHSEEDFELTGVEYWIELPNLPEE